MVGEAHPTELWAEAKLFKLKDTVKTNVYLSFGSAIRRLTKGKSSYREIQGMKMRRRGSKQTGKRTQWFEAAAMERHSAAWTTPRGVELFVVRPGDDKPDQIACLVERLWQCYAHFGEWTIKPAPLHFERVLNLQPTAENGLEVPSQIMVDKITTVRKEKLRQAIGHLTSAEIDTPESRPVPLAGLEQVREGFLSLELVDIQAFLRHMDLSKMQIYTHVSEDRMAGCWRDFKIVGHAGLSSIWVSLPLYPSYACYLLPA